MTRSEFAKGSATFLVVIVAGFLSTTEIDRRYAASQADKTVSAPSPSATACIGEDGAWKNWPWPNVPALSPKCGRTANGLDPAAGRPREWHAEGDLHHRHHEPAALYG